MKPSNRRNVGLLAATLCMGICIALPSTGCVAGTESIEMENVGDTKITFKEFEAQVYQDERGVYVLDGDMVFENREELEQFFVEHVQQGALVLYTFQGADMKWNDAEKLNLTYCVSTNFGANYNAVKAAMASAAANWELAAKVNFVHLSAHDTNCTNSNTNVMFDVRPISGQSYYAVAFYPKWARVNRTVFVNSLSFALPPPLTLTGILRHELGHTLGFRHEHVRPEAAPTATCWDEGSSWRALTSYDPASVMHYPWCKGTNTGDLVLTAKDKAGVASVYGAL